MESVKKLGLEVIELEDQILLVDDKIDEGLIYIPKNGIIAEQIAVKYNDSYKEGVRILGNKGHKRIIASTKPLEGLPLLVIEDEAIKNCEEWLLKVGLKKGSIAFTPYINGYNKAKEKYQFTEKDLREAIHLAQRAILDSSKIGTSTYTHDEIVQFLTKKELWIDVYVMNEGYTNELDNPYHKCFIPKIVNNQINAVWI